MASVNVHLDFETRSEVDLPKAGSHVYARHPSTQIQVACYKIGTAPVRKWVPGDDSPVDLINHVIAGHPVVAHNAAGFEVPIWNEVGRRGHGWPELRIEQVHCTMSMAAAMSVPMALEKAAAALGISAQKDLKGRRVMMQLCKPREYRAGKPVWYEREDFPEKFEDLDRYCEQDVEVEYELFQRLLPLSASERDVWILDHKINQRGIQSAVEAAKAAGKLIDYEKGKFNARIQKISKGFISTYNETGRFREWIESRGVPDVPSIAKADVIELLSREDLPKDVREALVLRQEAAKSSTAKLESMLAGVCEDGRIRGLFQYHGAGTGRWASRRLQVQNFPRGSLTAKQVEEVFAILGAIE